MNTNSSTGRCLCGAIVYQVDDIGPLMGHCHCSMCRKFHGSAFATFGEARKEDFRWLEGEHLLTSYQAKNGTRRRFCKNCGSSLTFSAAEDIGAVVEFTLGTLDDPINLKPDAHIYVKSKADWFDICDALPQYDRGRPDS